MPEGQRRTPRNSRADARFMAHPRPVQPERRFVAVTITQQPPAMMPPQNPAPVYQQPVQMAPVPMPMLPQQQPGYMPNQMQYAPYPNQPAAFYGPSLQQGGMYTLYAPVNLPYGYQGQPMMPPQFYPQPPAYPQPPQATTPPPAQELKQPVWEPADERILQNLLEEDEPRARKPDAFIPPAVPMSKPGTSSSFDMAFTPKKPMKKPKVQVSGWQKVLQDNVSSIENPATPKKARKGVVFIRKVALVVPIAVFILGLGTSGVAWQNNRKVAKQMDSLQQQAGSGHVASAQTSATPGETAPSTSAFLNHSVTAGHPKFLFLSTINKKARIVAVDKSGENDIQAPENIHDVGWYRKSARPGDSGALLLNGHVSGATQPGVFAEIKQLKEGDVIKMESGDGRSFTYRVVTVKQYEHDAVDLGAAMASIYPGKAGLNLMTAAGNFNPAINDYQQRLVVFTTQM